MKWNVIKRTGLLSAACIVLALTVFSGCSSNKTNNGAAATKSETPLDLSIVAINFNPGFTPKPDVKTILEKHTNTKLDLNFVPSASYDEKISALLASGDLPDVFTVRDPKAPFVINAIRAGIFWDISPYLKDYPNIMKLYSPEVLRQMEIDGKHYFLSLAYNPNGSIITYRKDWLDNLGLQPPQTVDEFYNMLKAFKENDPDKNGKNDTFGLIESKDALAFNRIKVWFGAPNFWGVKDGKLYPDFTTPEYLDAMNFMRRLYQEKLINQDFPAANVAQYRDYLFKGKAGVELNSAGNLTGELYKPLFQANPNAKFDFVGGIKGPKGLLDVQTKGYNRSFLFSKNKIKTVDHLKRVLTFYNQISDPEMTKLIFLGVEGKHYKMEGDKPVVLDEQAWKDDMLDFNRIALADPFNGRLQYGFGPMDKRLWDQINRTDIKRVTNAALELVNSPDIVVDDKIIDDARTKYIIGDLDESGWKAAIEKWRNNNGNKLIEDYSAQYAKVK